MRAVTPITRHIGRVPVIVGGGIAGLMTALRLAPMPAVVLAKAALQTEASSAWAQGGIAAAVGPDDDPALHLADTLAAGDGLCDADVARRVTAAGPAAVEMLLQYGVRFDRDPAGTIRLGREAAHARRRIVHATGDGTGREIMRALAAAVRQTPSITVLEDFEVRRLIVVRRHGQRRAGGIGIRSGAAADQPCRAGDRRHRRVVPATPRTRGDRSARVSRSRRGPGRLWLTWSLSSSTRRRSMPEVIR